MAKEIIITVDMLGEEATVEMAERMAELLELQKPNWSVSVGEASKNTIFDDPDDQYEFDKLWKRCLNYISNSKTKDDRLTLIYSEGSTRVELGKILTNKSISIDDAIDILGVDMDKLADAQGWDGWNWECLYLVDAQEPELVSLSEYAETHKKEPATVRQKVLRGGFKTAVKIGRDWLIDKNEPYTDLRKKPE